MDAASAIIYHHRRNWGKSASRDAVRGLPFFHTTQCALPTLRSVLCPNRNGAAMHTSMSYDRPGVTHLTR